MSGEPIASVGASPIRALCFDVFGTVVDWRSSIAREVRALARQRAIRVDANDFADRWRAGYVPAMQRVRAQALGWTNIDELHRLILEDVLRDLAITAFDGADKAHLTLAWHRLRAWPDVVRGLKRLKSHYTIATLSNGNISLLNDLSKNAGLPWDVLFSAELFQHYKPDPETYLGAARLLGLAPNEVMMVAAHRSDLRAAAGCGLATALVERSLEYGAGRHPEPGPDPGFDFNARDLNDLATLLGC